VTCRTVWAYRLGGNGGPPFVCAGGDLAPCCPSNAANRIASADEGEEHSPPALAERDPIMSIPSAMAQRWDSLTTEAHNKGR